MQGIYLDNASTSFPKAPGVGRAMLRYIGRIGANVNRGGYPAAADAADVVLSLRESLCRLFGAPSPEYCVITPGMTWGLNMALRGYCRPGDHVLTSSMEHNSMMRPLDDLQRQGVCVERVPCRADGGMDVCALERMLRPDTRLVATLHASNVCGTILPAEQIGALCQKRGVAFLLDAAQTAGHLELDMASLGADALIVSGHKGLLGPQGIGVLMLSARFARELVPLCTGGTGSRSDSLRQPEELPDKFEPGTLNLPGIFGLARALRFLERRGIPAIRRHEMALCARFLRGISQLSGVRLLGTGDLERRVAVIALDFVGQDNAQVAYRLDKRFGIATRCGLHCAPLAHQTLGSYPAGAVRFSIGWRSTVREIDAALAAIAALA